uniref:AAA+ ATPase domain-containing protein n=1 Tax=Mantoniella antarctica TaxID=81844 RepID=A0A6U3DFL0_9CHLO|mmetsp:Transcript_11496/g.27939  ORF Transcript_11496/g.27939 Transcript_11496/m.27939 type:complete len:331 (+) Transcript_11496:57-1049(+)
MPPTNAPWVEKYRPRTMSDVAHQDEVVRTLEKAIETANMPHMLFYGPPGTGKTTCALAICRQLYGPELFKSRVLELNASDERGISVVRTKIKGFASTAVGAGVPGYPSPPYKILILDEADSMTTDAQSALRRTMETYSKVTRFFILCNYISRIIEPIASRCAKFRFKPLGHEVMGERLQFIAHKEGLSLGEGVFEATATHSGGDLRKAITLLQSAARLFGTNTITGKDIVAVAGAIPNPDIVQLIELCSKNMFDKAMVMTDAMSKDGFPALQILTQLAEELVVSASVGDAVKARVALRIAQADKALTDGADESLQLGAVLSVACLALSGK